MCVANTSVQRVMDVPTVQMDAQEEGVGRRSTAGERWRETDARQHDTKSRCNALTGKVQ